MRSRFLLPCALVGGSLLAACSNDVATSPTAEAAAVNASVSSGETFSRIGITNPSTTYYSMGVGAVKQMYATLYYSKGGTLAGVPYAAWMAVDPCIAKVTTAYPSWGKVTGVKSGTTLIIATAWGKADTVKVTVSGTGNLDPYCYTRLWTFNTSDVSFTGTPATSYSVKSGETLKKVVLFAPKYPIKVGQTIKLVSELWYSGGGKLNGVPYVNYTSTDGSVATIDYRTGYATGRKIGRTKIIVRMGTNMADTVPLYVQ